MIVFRSIKPAKPFKSSIFRDELKTAAAQMEKKILADFEKTTATWEHDVKFKASVEAGAAAGGVGVEVTTKDKVYGYVDEGTRPHIIRPKKLFDFLLCLGQIPREHRPLRVRPNRLTGRLLGSRIVKSEKLGFGILRELCIARQFHRAVCLVYQRFRDWNYRHSITVCFCASAIAKLLSTSLPQASHPSRLFLQNNSKRGSLDTLSINSYASSGFSE